MGTCGHQSKRKVEIRDNTKGISFKAKLDLSDSEMELTGVRTW